MVFASSKCSISIFFMKVINDNNNSLLHQSTGTAEIHEWSAGESLHLGSMPLQICLYNKLGNLSIGIIPVCE